MSEQEKTDTGGAAYPLHWAANQHGMTLLDYFAGQALAGMLAYSHINPSHGNWVENCAMDICASQAYEFAACMIAEKRKREGQ